eukprot:Clim_evm20s77 gene=Clim_evmTU20s77
MRVWGYLFLFALLLVCLVDANRRDLYEVLGVQRNASEADIRKAYRKLARSLHPDKNQDDPHAEEKFAELQSAYDVLSDEEKKVVYDREGFPGLERMEDGGRGGRGGGGFDPFADFFGSFFGGGHRNAQRRGDNIVADLLVTLEDIYNGATFEVEVVKKTICSHCHGSGAASQEAIQQCPKCQGRGQIVVEQRLGPGMVQRMQRPCNVCGGTGVKITEKCPVCEGKKHTRGKRKLTVDVEAGIPDGEPIVFVREGDQEVDTIPGDVIFRIATQPHSTFVRDGNNLEVKLDISLKDALQGFSTTRIHLDGHEFVIARDGVSQPGDVLTVVGEGMPYHEMASKKGDLFVKIQVVIPTDLDASKTEQIAQLLG